MKEKKIVQLNKEVLIRKRKYEESKEIQSRIDSNLYKTLGLDTQGVRIKIEFLNNFPS